MPRIPENGIWKQPNLGDRFPSLRSTFNIDLVNEQGKLKIGRRLMINTSGLRVPIGFAYNSTLSAWFALGWNSSGGKIYRGGDVPSDGFSLDSASSQPTLQSTTRPDIAVMNFQNTDYTFVMDAELSVLNSGGTAWSTITSIGGSANGAPLIPFKGRLYFKAGQIGMGSVGTSDGSDAAYPAFPNSGSDQYSANFSDYTHTINCGTANSNYIYLGTLVNPGGNALVIEWNGSSTAASGFYEIDARGVLAAVVKENVPFVFDSEGVLRKFNGTTFEEKGRLPFKKGKLLPSPDASVTSRLVGYNGMEVDGDVILINVNAKYADGTTDENVPSGWWAYTEENGLFHISSPSLWVSGTTTTETDYGAKRVSKVGAIKRAEHADTTANGRYLSGFEYYTDATSVDSGVFLDDFNDTAVKFGSFTTYWIPSKNVKDILNKLTAFVRKFLNSTDKIIVKFRTEKEDPLEITGTWASTSTFNTATDLRDYIGYEVEVLNGTGAGKTAHITTVTENGASGWLITLDDTFTGVTTGTFKAHVTNFTKFGSFSKQNDDAPQFSIGKAHASARVQLKMSVQCTGEFELEYMDLDTTKHQ